jgi:hypothetical protein
MFSACSKHAVTGLFGDRERGMLMLLGSAVSTAGPVGAAIIIVVALIRTIMFYRGRR